MKQTAHRLLIDWPKQNSYSHQPVEESTVHTGQEEQENPRLTQEPSPCDPSPLKDTGPEEEAIQEKAILAEKKSTIPSLDSPEPQQSVLERPNNRRPSPLMAPTEERPVFAATGNISSTGGQKGQLSIPQRRKDQMLLTQHQRQILPAIESTPGVKVKPNLLPKEVWYDSQKGAWTQEQQQYHSPGLNCPELTSTTRPNDARGLITGITSYRGPKKA